ncbi:hypothetical protein Clacol_007590 [Clathrus columnatus]|uniref:Zn(2)-C6 fungal-type domain-containing protein n=1 Tax=Clathrus columnatus TaxID=1419009 RepID=A0AAV5AIJ4_9AGAM|nr:hypothetical protein Clacol_007590 [Clathrus columnatus]
MHSQATPASLPTRKQNVACDACRTRKVRCVMASAQEKHCQSKGYPCTFNVQRETSEKRKQGGPRKKSWNNNNNSVKYDGITPPALLNTPTNAVTTTSDTHIFSPAPPTTPSIAPFYSDNFSSVIPLSNSNPISVSPPAESSNHPFVQSQAALQPESSTTRLLAYLFAPEQYSSTSKDVMCCYRSSLDYAQRHNLVAEDWGEVGVKLQDPSFRREFTLDLVEVYFEIYHARVALLSPTRFREQLHAALTPSSSPNDASNGFQSQCSPKDDALNPAILATVLAWGAKFSEHPLIVQDRNADTTGKRRSRLAASLRNKAFEIAEAEKVHIVPSSDAIVVGLLLDGLHSRYRGFWLSCTLRHLLHLKINNRFADHSLITSDYRQTLTEDDDYNIDLYPQDLNQIAQSVTTDSHEQLAVVKRQEFLVWYTASHEIARRAREMSRQLWRPVVQTEGISHNVIRRLMHSIYEWQAKHLDKVGVPSSQVNWDFLAAVNACGHDALYHTLWIILYQAIQEFGIREIHEIKRTIDVSSHLNSDHAQYAATEDQVRKEALNSASRIACLADLLTQNGYLRLDPNIMHFNIYNAGKLLAQFGRREVMMCIRGLQQYGLAYEEAFYQAEELQQIYNTCISDQGASLSAESSDDTSSAIQLYKLTNNGIHLIRAPS